MIHHALRAMSKSSTFDTDIVTVGTITLPGPSTYYGFIINTIGSCSDGNFAVKAGAQIEFLYYNETADSITFQINGTHTNDGWTTMEINGVPFARGDASFTSNNNWTWSTIVSNPFTGVGTDTTVVWT